MNELDRDTNKFLIEKAKEVNSILCFGIDPVLNRIPLKDGTIKDRILNYFTPIIDALIKDDVISAIKPNIAYFSQYGNEGLKALEQIIQKYKGKLPIILDAKRADIGRSSEAYAKELYDVWNADAITVHPYMGFDSVKPFLREGKVAYLLVKTSNKGSKDFQELYANGMPLYKHVAIKSNEWHMGMVIGATNTKEQLEEIVDAGIQTPLLIPGIGAQGGSLENVGYLIKNSKINPYAHRINVSSGIAYAYEKCEDKTNPINCAIESAKKYKQMINEHVDYNNDYKDYNNSENSDGAKNLSKAFTDFLVNEGVLKFGDFTLKSGRKSPYFVKMDVLSNGRQLYKMADFYAKKILQNVPDVEAIYGPAYKGIPLASVITTVMFVNYGKKVVYCSDRKEEKKHGDKGKFLGANISNKNTVIVDDVMTTGETKLGAIQKIKNNFDNVHIKGVFIAVDREEKWETDLASKEFKKRTGIPVYAITKISDVFAQLHNKKINGNILVNDDIMNMYKQYRKLYGVGVNYE